ncbi:MAG: hypothetical protein KF782_12855 [Labilithrix sp.]|nr:hypothetical protein [Labilithrix sp.]
MAAEVGAMNVTEQVDAIQRARRGSGEEAGASRACWRRSS